jgi:tRNA (mo5U34)-methyltransferase
VVRDPELLNRIKEWNYFHTIDLGDGLVTTGHPSSQLIARAVPEVAGKSVLDIGAWDGKYSFEAEQSGASRVVALDHYIWRLDHVARSAYYDHCKSEGVLPDPEMIDNGFLMDSLHGKTGFDLAHAWLDSKVESVVDDFMTTDLAALGTFDVVLYFGVLYHMVDPVGALRRLRSVTKELAVIETAAVLVPGYEGESLSAFFAGDDLHADHGNWFAPNELALHGMCRSAGFRRVETRGTTLGSEASSAPARQRRRRLRSEPASPAPSRSLEHCRLIVYAVP